MDYRTRRFIRRLIRILRRERVHRYLRHALRETLRQAP
jgi:hypothetical protein